MKHKYYKNTSICCEYYTYINNKRFGNYFRIRQEFSWYRNLWDNIQVCMYLQNPRFFWDFLCHVWSLRFWSITEWYQWQIGYSTGNHIFGYPGISWKNGFNILCPKMCSLRGGDFRNQFSVFGLYVMPTHG